LSPEQNRLRQRAKRRERATDAVRLWIPLSLVLGLCDGARQEHASILYYLISLVMIVASVVIVIVVSLAAPQLSAVSLQRRPRWLYALLAAVYLTPVGFFVGMAMQHAHAHTADSQWAPIVGLIAANCALAALVMLGRAIAWGPKRRVFWLYPPLWLDMELSGIRPRQVTEAR
jgi:ABC-type glycerol-3-phosphate transport system permease component